MLQLDAPKMLYISALNSQILEYEEDISNIGAHVCVIGRLAVVEQILLLIFLP